MNSGKAIIAIIILLIFVLLYPITLAAQTISLDQAVSEGKVQVEIFGLGGSTGDTILIKIKRKIPTTLRISLTPGTVFESTSGNVQNMIGSKIKGERAGYNIYHPMSEIYLNNDDEREYVVEAYCLDFHKSNPGTSNSFSLSQIDDRTKNIIVAGEKAGYSIEVIQSAIWIDRDRVTSSELKSRFSVSDEDIDSAQELLKEFDSNGNIEEEKEPITSRNDENDEGLGPYTGFLGPDDEPGCFIMSLN